MSRDFEQRSPLNLADKISAPVLIFQWNSDILVVLEQSLIYKKLLDNGLRAELINYSREGYVLRKDKTLIDALKEKKDSTSPSTYIKKRIYIC